MAKISNKKYKDMQENKPCEEIWVCNEHLHVTKFSSTCSICLRELGKLVNGIPYNCCNFLGHKK